MEILVFTKKDKPGIGKMLGYLKIHFHNVVTYTGKRGDKFPAKSFEYKPDFLISYLSPWIIPKDLLNQTKKWNINFHPGPPNYPGIGCTNFAIYNEEKIFGVTAHIMEKEVDRGKIIGVKEFAILETDNIYSLTMRSYKYLLSLFFEVFDHIIKRKALPECNKKWVRKPYTRKELEELCRITPDMSEGEIGKRIKATQFPGMPGSYIELYGYRFEYNPDR